MNRPLRVGLDILRYTILFVVAIAMLFPVLWMFLLSVKERPESYSSLVELIVSPYTLRNFTDSLSSDAFGIYFLNSLIVALAVTAGNVLFCFVCGYAFARNTSRVSSVIFASVLAVMMIPTQVIMIPMYHLMVSFGWINTYWALIVPWLVTPFGVFLVRQYVVSLPSELEDAARIDGASYFYVLFRLVFPLCRPVLTVLAIYTFLSNWNSFLFPFLLTNDEALRTLPVGLSFYMGKQSIDWGHLMAGAGLSAIPILLLFTFFQRRIIEGLTAGALKG